jgi:hypothetical protein
VKVVVSFYLLLICVLFSQAQNTLVLDRNVLEAQRKELRNSPSSKIATEIGALIRKADKLATAGKTFSVTNKSALPPSGDKHDYLSQAPYFWPDPAKPNGLPYIQRDGERNPELAKFPDHDELDKMIVDSEQLALAYYFTGNEKYAVRAAQILRTWFLDPRSRQNPNLRFAQFVPGRSDGRGFGLIETRQLYRALDASILIERSKAWTKTDRKGLKEWFAQFAQWMIDSPNGKAEAGAKNNHGTHYDVQIVAYSIFTGRPDLARKQLEITKRRIASQIESDGRQPLELARTLSWGYVNMNLQGYFTLARLGESVGADLWNYSTTDGRGIKKAFEWLAPYAAADNEWTYKQIKPRTFDNTVRLLRTAAVRYKEPKYSAIADRLETAEKKSYATFGTY